MTSERSARNHDNLNRNLNRRACCFKMTRNVQTQLFHESVIQEKSKVPRGRLHGGVCGGGVYGKVFAGGGVCERVFVRGCLREGVCGKVVAGWCLRKSGCGMVFAEKCLRDSGMDQSNRASKSKT